MSEHIEDDGYDDPKRLTRFCPKVVRDYSRQRTRRLEATPASRLKGCERTRRMLLVYGHARRVTAEYAPASNADAEKSIEMAIGYLMSILSDGPVSAGKIKARCPENLLHRLPKARKRLGVKWRWAIQEDRKVREFYMPDFRLFGGDKWPHQAAN